MRTKHAASALTQTQCLHQQRGELQSVHGTSSLAFTSNRYQNINVQTYTYIIAYVPTLGVAEVYIELHPSIHAKNSVWLGTVIYQ